MTDFHRFPLSNFKYFLTLFSKFFSSFPHGTCSLSVSRWYLAFDEISYFTPTLFDFWTKVFPLFGYTKHPGKRTGTHCVPGTSTFLKPLPKPRRVTDTLPRVTLTQTQANGFSSRLAIKPSSIQVVSPQLVTRFSHAEKEKPLGGKFHVLYHQLRAAIPNNSTLRKCIVHGKLQVTDGIVTLNDALFQRTYTWVTRWQHFFSLQFGKPLSKPIYTLSSSRFTRRY